MKELDRKLTICILAGAVLFAGGIVLLAIAKTAIPLILGTLVTAAGIFLLSIGIHGKRAIRNRNR